MTLFGRLKYVILADFAIQWSLSIPAIIFKTEKFYDLSGAATTATLAWLALKSFKSGSKPSSRQIINTSMITLWAVRLSSFLFARILKDGKDRRFNKARSKPAMMFLFWTIQAVWILLDGLPAFILNTREDNEPTTLIDWVGRALFVFGFLFQVIADEQKSAFRSDRANHSKFIESGLWSLCQHPNYFGEICIWFGIWLSHVSALKGEEHIAVLSPLFTTFLLNFVSGVPLLQKHAKKKWGNNMEFQEYQRTTPLLIPSLRKVLKKLQQSRLKET